MTWEESDTAECEWIFFSYLIHCLEQLKDVHVRENMCVRERECVHVCKEGGICGNLLEGITSVIQLPRAFFFFFSFLGEAVGEEEYHLVSEYKWLDFAWEKKDGGGGA